MSRLRSVTAALAVLALTASMSAPLHAQRSATDSSAVVLDSTPVASTAATALPLTPSPMVFSPVALRAVVNADAPLPPMYRERTSRSVAMMIVGGAALIVGSVVGGDSGTIIMVGGGVIGLIGLWNYLK